MKNLFEIVKKETVQEKIFKNGNEGKLFPEIENKSFNVDKERLEKLKELFPNIVSDGKIDWKTLKLMLGENITEEDERYRFTWSGKSKAIREVSIPTSNTLRPCDDDINSKNWEKTKNIYIEGDNLEVLKILQNSYNGKIKMIYIDPPYNTGSDFIYEDDFTLTTEEVEKQEGLKDKKGVIKTVDKLGKNSKESSKYHTNWLNMMYPRLSIARDLLTEDGVIFISIDDNEIHNLRKICTEIFGEENFIGTISVENNPKGRKNSDFISISSEYLLIFSKNKKESYFIENIPKNASDMREDENGNFVHSSGKRVLVGENSFNNIVTNFNSDKNYSVYYRKCDKSLHITKEEYGVIDEKLINNNFIRYSSFYNGILVENTYTENKLHELFENNALEFSEDKIYEKNYNDTIRIKSQLVNREYEAIVKGKKIKFSLELTTTGAGTYLKDLFELKESPFSAPKNVGYLKLLISLFEKESFIVLDFFSGSGSLGDAVMQLNAEDNGNRKFILVQLPENLEETLIKADSKIKKTVENAIEFLDSIKKPHFLTEIGKERIRRAGEKIIKDNPDKDLSELDIGFKTFKVDSSNFNEWDISYEAMEKSVLESSNGEFTTYKADRTHLDLVYEIMLKEGMSLTETVDKIKIGADTIYKIADGVIYVFLGRLNNEIIEAIVKMKKEVQELLGLDNPTVIINETYLDTEIKSNAKKNFEANGIRSIKTL